MMQRRHGIVALLILAFAGSACDHSAEDQRQKERAEFDRLSAERARAEEERQRIEQEKLRIRAQPSTYLEPSDLAYYDKGIINDYRQLVGVSVLNKSKYPLRNISGDVEWLDDSGARVGSMPFALKGSIVPGDTKRFTGGDGTLSNGTIQTTAKRARLRFTSVEIVETK